MHQARKELIVLLRDETAYVNRIAKGDVAKILGSGFHVSKEDKSRTYPEFWAEHGAYPGEILVGHKAIPGVKATLWQFCQSVSSPAETAWILAGASTKSKMTLQNLDIDQLVWLRYSGVNRFGMLPWSDPIKIKVT